MANILAIGIATLDIINTVDSYPVENTELRANSQRRVRGGNATNTLCVLSQLGHDGFWAGILVDEPDSDLIKNDLSTFNIDFSACRIVSTGKIPTSYITLSAATGSRSIVHHRDCPEFSLADFKNINIDAFDWLHFEGRNIADTYKMFDWLKQHHPSVPFSLEIEKPRYDIESLFNTPSILMFSKLYAETKGYSSGNEFLQSFPDEITATCTWGGQGAWGKTESRIIYCPAFPPPKVIDTLGAGDTFNAGLISALLEQKTLDSALFKASQLAGEKCGQIGFLKLN